MRAAAIVLVAGMGIAACSAGTGVDVESRRPTESPVPTSDPAPDDVSPTSPPPTTTTVPEPGDPDESPVVRYVLDAVVVEVRLRPTRATPLSDDPDGFSHGLELVDGRLVAAGFDGPDSEPAALWLSDDGVLWERVGLSVGDAVGRQDIDDLVLDDGVPSAFGTSSDDPPAIGSVNRWASDASAVEWTTTRSLPESSVNRAVVVGERITTVGATDHDEPGGFLGSVASWLGGAATDVSFTDVDASGDPIPGSEVVDLAVDPVDGSWLAVGLTTISDPGRTGSEDASDAGTPVFPSDVAVWRSRDDGRSWSAVDIERYDAIAGAQQAVRVLHTDGRWWMLTEEHRPGGGPVRRLSTSADGERWEPDPYRRMVPADVDDVLATTELSLVDGIVVVVDEVFVAGAPSMVVTMIDPTTGASDQHDLTIELAGVHGVADVIELSADSTGLGFGRIERGPGTSDLQVIEISRSDEPPDPDDPAPTTTAPPSGGGSSDA